MSTMDQFGQTVAGRLFVVSLSISIGMTSWKLALHPLRYTNATGLVNKFAINTLGNPYCRIHAWYLYISFSLKISRM